MDDEIVVKANKILAVYERNHYQIDVKRLAKRLGVSQQRVQKYPELLEKIASIQEKSERFKYKKIEQKVKLNFQKNELEELYPLGENEIRFNLLVYKKDYINSYITEFRNCSWKEIPLRVKECELLTKDYKEYYYRFLENKDYIYYNDEIDQSTPEGRNKSISYTHFGVTFKSHILKINKYVYLEMYLNHCIQTINPLWNVDMFIRVQIMGGWFDSRMQKYKQSTPEKLSECIDVFNRFDSRCMEITELNEMKKRCGLYLMVLDEYNLCYTGKTIDIRRRIIQHWTNHKYFTGTGIDMFKAKDTTRIYAIPMDQDEYEKNIDEYEVEIIRRLREINGGITCINIAKGGTESDELFLSLMHHVKQLF